MSFFGLEQHIKYLCCSYDCREEQSPLLYYDDHAKMQRRDYRSRTGQDQNCIFKLNVVKLK